MSVTPDVARECALDLIRRYVERGDRYEYLKEGAMGSYSNRYCAAIGSSGIYGCPVPKRLGADALSVGEVNRVKCCYVFSLRELYDEIKTGTKQLSLFISDEATN